VEDIWKKMNSGLPNKMPKPTMAKLSNTAKEKKNKPTNVSSVCCINLSSNDLFDVQIFYGYIYLLEFLLPLRIG
jgi:hypothetical protein